MLWLNHLDRIQLIATARTGFVCDRNPSENSGSGFFSSPPLSHNAPHTTVKETVWAGNA